MRRYEIEQKGMPDGRCKGCEYCKGRSAGNWNFYSCTHSPYQGKWVAEIKDCPKEAMTAEEGK